MLSTASEIQVPRSEQFVKDMYEAKRTQSTPHIILKIHFNLIISRALASPKCSIYFRFSRKTVQHFTLLTRAIQVPSTLFFLMTIPLFIHHQFQSLNYLTDFNKTCCRRHATGTQSYAILANSP